MLGSGEEEDVKGIGKYTAGCGGLNCLHE